MTGTEGEISGRKRRFFDLPRESQARDAHDFYIEPRWCVDLLLDAVSFEGNVWDPACGCGTIPKACAARGLEAAGSDLVDRGYGERLDFLAPMRTVFDVDNIVTNPPYGAVAEAFIRRAVTIATRKVAVLVQAKFPYSQTRYRLFMEHPPARLLFLSWRPSMPPGELLLAGKIKPEGGKMDFLWVVWDRAHVGPTTCGWLGAPKK